MKVIYIAGKYRDSRGEWFVQDHIREASIAALFVWQHGAAAICPHRNTALFGGYPGCPDETWLKGDLEIIKRCDAVWAIHNWKDSVGATSEVGWARHNNIPVLFSRQEVVDFICKEDKP